MSDRAKPGWIYLRVRADRPCSPLEICKSVEQLPPYRTDGPNGTASSSNATQNDNHTRDYFTRKADRDLLGYPLKDDSFDGWYWRPSTLLSPRKTQVLVDTVTSRVLIHFNVLDTWTFEFLSIHVHQLSGPIISGLVLVMYFLPIQEDFDRICMGAIKDLQKIYGNRRKVERQILKEDPSVDAAVVKVVRENISFYAAIKTELIELRTSRRTRSIFCFKK